MFGAIPAEWLMELARDTGIMTQIELDIPRHYIINEEYLTRCMVQFHHLNGKGQKTGSTSDVDHPAFTALREHLGATGRIKIERNWCNGDRVTNPFYLNDKFFDNGDQFSCASAMGISLRVTNRINKSDDHSQESGAI